MQITELLEAAEKFVERELHRESDGHDFDHTFRVVRHAMTLCDALPEADRNIVHLAVILHDVARPEEAASSGKLDHAELGSRKAYDFLVRSGCPEPLANSVAQCIREHRYRSACRPSTLEAQILFDADKLDSLGAVGIARALRFAAKINARLHNTEAEALAGQAYGKEDTAYREYLVKLSKLPDVMLTEPGRRKARELAGFMAEFFHQLDREIYGEAGKIG